MRNPQYILLTIRRVTSLVDDRGRPANPPQIRILQPPLRQLFVLPVSFAVSANGTEAAELQQGPQVITFAERFDDVLEAIDRAALDGLAIARPVNVEGLRDAVKQSRTFPMPSPAGAHMGSVHSAEIEATRARLLDRQAEGAKHQGEIAAFDDPGKCEHGNAHGSSCPFCPDHVATPSAIWDDFVQTSGENVGAPASARYPQAGDLRIANALGDRFWVEIAAEAEGAAGFTWARDGVPDELKPLYATREAAQTAVKLAGYARRLWEE